MKKLFLTSLLIATAASGAHAANIIDGNPLYMPKAGHFYSETALSSHSETTKNWALTEDFGYGVTDQLAISMKAGFAEMAEDMPGGDDEMFDRYGWTDLGLKATFRALDKGEWKADVYGEYNAGAVMPGAGGLIVSSDLADDTFWFDEDLTGYTWTAGVRGGYMSDLFTVAGHLEFVYLGDESFNWGEEGAHFLKLGLDGQLVIDPSWNLVGGVEYTGVTDDGAKDAGAWTGYIGMNYNIDATKYVGAYVNGRMAHGTGDWEMDDGFGFGMKFGIDF